MDRRLKLRHFQCFLEAARSSHLAEVAEALAITPAAVSKTLTELEDIMQARLLIRERSGLRLTSQGELFFHYASAGLSALEKSYEGVAGNLDQPRVEVRLGVLPTVAARFMPATLNEFLQGHRHVNLALETGYNRHLLEMLHGGKIDLAVARIGSHDMMQALSFIHLYAEPMVLIARRGHPLFALKGSARLRAVTDYPFLFPPPNTRVRPVVEQALVNLGINLPHTLIETLSNTFGRSFLPTSDAIWMISYGVVEDMIANGTLELVTEPQETSREPVGVVHREDQEISAPSRQLINILLNQTRHLRP